MKSKVSALRSGRSVIKENMEVSNPTLLEAGFTLQTIQISDITHLHTQADCSADKNCQDPAQIIQSKIISLVDQDGRIWLPDELPEPMRTIVNKINEVRRCLFHNLKDIIGE